MQQQEATPLCLQLASDDLDSKNVFLLQRIHAANSGARYDGPGLNRIGLIINNGGIYRQRESLMVPVFCMADMTRAVLVAVLWENVNGQGQT